MMFVYSSAKMCFKFTISTILEIQKSKVTRKREGSVFHNKQSTPSVGN